MRQQETETARDSDSAWLCQVYIRRRLQEAGSARAGNMLKPPRLLVNKLESRTVTTDKQRGARGADRGWGEEEELNSGWMKGGPPPACAPRMMRMCSEDDDDCYEEEEEEGEYFRSRAGPQELRLTYY